MAQPSPYENIGMLGELMDLQEAQNRLRGERNLLLEMCGPLPPPPPPSRLKRAKTSAYWLIVELRTRLARRIAPWLEVD